MKMQRRFAITFIICIALIGIFLFPKTAYAKKIANTRQAEKTALNKVKNAVVTEVDKDYEKGTIVYEVYLIKGTKKYEITYRASDGKMLSYGWEERNINRNSKKKIMSKSNCKKLAKKKVKNGKITSLVKKYDDGIDIYKVKMTKSNKKYELKYNARTGKLLEYEWQLVTKTTKKQTTYIGVDKAKSIALKKVPGADVVKVEFDKDDGVPVYEVTLIKDEFEYEIKIHAKTGKILEIEREYRD